MIDVPLPLTRRRLVGAAAASALAAAGVYELADRLSPRPARAAGGASHPPEQHVLQDLRIVSSDGVDAFAPPLHSQVLTAGVAVGGARSALAAARREPLEHRLATLDGRYPATPAGLGLTVAWGLPYFRRLVPRQAARWLPLDRRASAAAGRPVAVLEDAVLFPSDPDGLVLEQNDVAVLLRSDSLDHIRDGAETVFGDGLFRITSSRRGFAGGGFAGGRSLPKRLALAAGVPGAHLIPERAELFLGFTSTQKQAPGRERIANLETLGYAAVGPDDYFAHGTHMHLSHVFEDLEAWYRLSGPERLASAFHPGLAVSPGTLTVPQGPRDVQTAGEVVHDYAPPRADRPQRLRSRPHHAWATTSSAPTGSCTGGERPFPTAPTSTPSTTRSRGLVDPAADRAGAGSRAGLHFVVFNPTSDDFASRAAGDGRDPPWRPQAAVRRRPAASGDQRRPDRDAPAELPRPASAGTARSLSPSSRPEAGPPHPRPVRPRRARRAGGERAAAQIVVST